MNFHSEIDSGKWQNLVCHSEAYLRCDIQYSLQCQGHVFAMFAGLYGMHVLDCVMIMCKPAHPRTKAIKLQSISNGSWLCVFGLGFVHFSTFCLCFVNLSNFEWDLRNKGQEIMTSLNSEFDLATIWNFSLQNMAMAHAF